MSENQVVQLSKNISNIVAAYTQDSYSIIAIEGEKSSQFLQGQITINSDSIEELDIKHGLYCDIKGRVEASFQLFKINNIFYMLLPSNNMEQTINELKKYAMLSRVNIKECNELVATFLFNIDSKDIFNTEPSNNSISPTEFGYISLNDMNSYLHITYKNKFNELKALLLEKKVNFIEQDLHKTINILNKQPIIFKQSRGIFLPHYINAVGKQVDFNKGCFRGQEVIARMQYKVKSYKYGAFIFKITNNDYTPFPGDVVKDENGVSIGNVIMASEHDKIALLMVSFSHIKHSKAVMVKNKPLELSDSHI